MSAVRFSAGAAAAVGFVAFVAARRQFTVTLDALDQTLIDAQSPPTARTDLPPDVLALAERLGVNARDAARYVDLRQTGSMWFKPRGHEQRFTARQRIGTTSSGFVWRAKIGPFGAMWVVDAFVAGRGMLEARLFGAVRVAKVGATAIANEGEGLRYLAELPLNPDAILFDHALVWSVDGPDAISVAIGSGASRAEIAFELDDTGLISTAKAASRAYGETGKRFPWHGRFWGYRESSGRRVPVAAEVAWIIDGKPFIYWRAIIDEWAAIAAP